MPQYSELFLQMRAEEMVTMYDSTFTKKEAIKTGENLIINALNDGNVGKHELMATIVRLKAVLDSAEGKLRSELPLEKAGCNGVDFSPVDGGVTINYSQDPIYASMEKDLKDRQELLKLAQKQELVLDAGGNEVPKVGTTPRKSSITIKF